MSSSLHHYYYAVFTTNAVLLICAKGTNCLLFHLPNPRQEENGNILHWHVHILPYYLLITYLLISQQTIFLMKADPIYFIYRWWFSCFFQRWNFHIKINLPWNCYSCDSNLQTVQLTSSITLIPPTPMCIVHAKSLNYHERVWSNHQLSAKMLGLEMCYYTNWLACKKLKKPVSNFSRQ